MGSTTETPPGLGFTVDIMTTTPSMLTTPPTTAWDTGQHNDNTTSVFSNTTGLNTTDYSPLDGPLEGFLGTPNWAVLSLIAAMGLGLAANLTVVVVVCTSKALHAPFTVLASLAVSDVLKTLTVMPLSILRLLFEGSLPRWICRLWSQLYLSYAGLTLTHLAVALLQCQVGLHRPDWYRRLSATCTAVLQVLLCWLLPVLLTLPHVLYTTLTREDPGPTSTTSTCLPLYPMYFTTGVLPTFLIPALLAAAIYVQLVMTMSIQRRAAAGDVQPEPVSEASSNGFVTYENSEASSIDEEHVGKHRHLHQEQGYHGNGYVTNDVIHHDVIVHDVMADDVSDVEACVAAEEGETAAMPPGEEPGNQTAQDPPQQHGQDVEDQVSDGPSGVVDSGLPLDHEDCVEDTATAGTAAAGINTTPTLKDAQQKAIEGVIRSTSCSSVNVLLVKTKVGKEALNEPLEDTNIDDVQLQMASYLISNPSYSPPEGVDNPAFHLEEAADMPLSESIKPKVVPPVVGGIEEGAAPITGTKEGSSSESLNVNGVGSRNGSTPTGVSRTSSFSGDENGYRSILKMDRAKRSSTKSVKFAVPQGQETQQPTNKPRLLSCKYKVKNGHRIRAGGKLIDTAKGATTAGTEVVKSPVESADGGTWDPKSLAKSAKFRYIAGTHREPGAQLTAQIKRTSRHARLLLVLLLVGLVCTTPYIATLTVQWFGQGDSLIPQSHSLILFSLLEWLGFMPYILYPFLYFAFSTEFRKALKAMLSKTVSSN